MPSVRLVNLNIQSISFVLEDFNIRLFPMFDCNLEFVSHDLPPSQSKMVVYKPRNIA